MNIDEFRNKRKEHIIKVLNLFYDMRDDIEKLLIENKDNPIIKKEYEIKLNEINADIDKYGEEFKKLNG